MKQNKTAQMRPFWTEISSGKKGMGDVTGRPGLLSPVWAGRVSSGDSPGLGPGGPGGAEDTAGA